MAVFIINTKENTISTGEYVRPLSIKGDPSQRYAGKFGTLRRVQMLAKDKAQSLSRKGHVVEVR